MRTAFISGLTGVLLTLTAAIFWQHYDTTDQQRQEISALTALLETEQFQRQQLTAVSEEVFATAPFFEMDPLSSEMRLLAGTADAQGTGLIITLTDNAALSDPEGIIHDSDLLMVINELRDAGAEVLSLNNQRLLSTSEVRCAGSIVSVNNVRLAAPFTISAIGPIDTMYGALHMNGGVVDTLHGWGFTILVERKDTLQIDAYSGTIQLLYASEVA